MKRQHTFILLFFLFPFFAHGIKQPKYVIGYNGPLRMIPRPGFFCAFLTVINHLYAAKKNGCRPVVHWDQRSPYFQFKNGNKNVWEYYFEPVSPARYNPRFDYLHITYDSIEPFFISPFKPPDRNTRKISYELIKEFIKLKPHVQEKIDTFYEKNMRGKITIGIHLRGTDKSTECPLPSPCTILGAANAYAQSLGKECQFFVATDEDWLLELSRVMLNGPVLSWDSCRSGDGRPVHLTPQYYDPQLKGEEVLIEAYLLARCQAFVYTCSNVAYAVLLLNPKIKDIFINAY